MLRDSTSPAKGVVGRWRVEISTKLWYNIQMLPEVFPLDFSLTRTAAVLVAVAALAAYDISRRMHRHPSHALFACILGTILSLGILGITQSFLGAMSAPKPHILGLAVLLVALLWRSLFGPWEVQTKGILLGVFLFWISLHIIADMAPAERSVRFIATIVALIPAMLWCVLFLKYHKERIGLVALMFFSGMLATAPILFYDALVRRGSELNFFVFALKPESFNRSADLFVSGGLLGNPGLKGTILATFLSFVVVAVIEEVSKYWVLRKSSEGFPTSIDDVIQFAIVVAIGFAFAENVLNSNYFMGFVREYLLRPSGADILGFLSNVTGRSVLTSMVHIVSTGVLGYFLGLAMFAGPYIRDGQRHGQRFPLFRSCSRVLHLPEETLFRLGTLTCGLLAAVLLHSVFNFLVTLPDLLPGNPRTIGDIFGSPAGSPFHWIALLLFPSLFYVCGGFWVLTGLFLRRENIQEFGHPVHTEVFVRG